MARAYCTFAFILFYFINFIKQNRRRKYSVIIKYHLSVDLEVFVQLFVDLEHVQILALYLFHYVADCCNLFLFQLIVDLEVLSSYLLACNLIMNSLPNHMLGQHSLSLYLIARHSLSRQEIPSLMTSMIR